MHDIAHPPRTPLFTRQTFVFLGFVILLSFLTYFFRYAEPQRVFWDENYHIASAQKYLHGVFFMEQHPPLGKLLVAAGEKLLQPNERTNQFLSTDYGRDFGDDFSFAGYRFFSALLAWWAAPLLFLIFLFITRHALFSTLLSFLYVFDNALIVHLRGAMLEGPLLFFSALTILCFILLLQPWKSPRTATALTVLFGAAFGLVTATKVLGLVFILLLPAYLWTLRPRSSDPELARRAEWWLLMLKRTGLFLLGFLITYIGVWYIHFALGNRIVTKLPDNGYYQASESYKSILKEGRNLSPLAFPVMLRDSLKFVSHYNRGTPRLDLCKADENGSPWYLWPLGGRTINFRWETPDGKDYRYLYLQSNPIVWLVSFAGILVGAALLLGSLVFELQRPLARPYLLTVFLGIYASYMIAISRIGRVLYLYHYFIPLFLSFIILGIVIMEIRRVWKWKITEHRQTIALLVLAGLIFAGFEYYRPFTYYEPITDAQFARRNLLPVWDLACVKCEKVNGVAVPCK